MLLLEFSQLLLEPAYLTSHFGESGGLDGAVHTVTISVSPDALDKREILFERNRPDFDKNPAKYEGASWYAGAIMLIGDLVE